MTEEMDGVGGHRHRDGGERAGPPGRGGVHRPAAVVVPEGVGAGEPRGRGVEDAAGRLPLLHGRGRRRRWPADVQLGRVGVAVVARDLDPDRPVADGAGLVVGRLRRRLADGHDDRRAATVAPAVGIDNVAEAVAEPVLAGEPRLGAVADAVARLLLHGRAMLGPARVQGCPVAVVAVGVDVVAGDVDRDRGVHGGAGRIVGRSGRLVGHAQLVLDDLRLPVADDVELQPVGADEGPRGTLSFASKPPSWPPVTATGGATSGALSRVSMAALSQLPVVPVTTTSWLGGEGSGATESIAGSTGGGSTVTVTVAVSQSRCRWRRRCRRSGR